MKKVININFQGRVIPIEESSYDMLKQYTESLRVYYANEEGRDEIINDIESRIGELFNERLKEGATCITDEHVQAIIAIMGRPEDFGDADEQQTSTSSSSSTGQTSSTFQATAANLGKKLYRDENNRVIGGVCSGIAAYFNIEPVIVRLIFIVLFAPAFIPYLVLWAFLPKSSNVINGVRRRLYRNPDDKMIAGVCSGLASYFGINVWIPRILFLVPFTAILFQWGDFDFPHFIGFTFSPGSLIIYIILWLTIPEATTTAEKLEMKGEKVDVNSIRNSVTEELNQVQQRMKKFGSEAKTVISEKGGAAGAEMASVARRTGSGIGNVIVFLVKAFAYFIVGAVVIAIVVALFGLAIAAVGLFPLMDAYILTDGWQETFAWGTIIFFIGVPVIGIITFIIRRIAKIKRGSAMIRYSFSALWILGWVCAVLLVTNVARDFKSRNTPLVEPIQLVNPGVKKLEVTPFPTSAYAHNMVFRFEPFANIDEDTMVVNNVRYRIIKSHNDSFHVSILKMANGRTRRYADTMANTIQFNIQQSDTLLYTDRGIPITPRNKFRNQFVEITIAVPVGKNIKLHKALGRYSWHGGPWRDWDYDDYATNEEHGWEYGEEYTMRADGLYTLTGEKAYDDDRRRGRSRFEAEDGNVPAPPASDYRFEDTDKKIDSLKEIKRLQMQKLKDSLDRIQKNQEELQRTLQQLQDKDERQEAHRAPELTPYSGILEV
jgi:phage shock protein PspC (stress-responsive transcriptional regulator)